jgi:hypothetical protein
MEENTNQNASEDVGSDRREAIQKLGRFAMYAAPFTVLALTAKGNSNTGSGAGATSGQKPRH